MNNLKDLTDEQLAIKAQSGDMLSAEELIKRYTGLVKNTARSFFLFGGDVEDLIQEGTLGLFKATMAYTIGTPFKNFASVCIKRNIISAVKSANREKHKVLNNYVDYATVFGEEAFETYFGDDSLDPAVMYSKREQQQELKDRFKKILSTLENEILGYYLNGYSYAEIADILGKTPKTVDNAMQRIRKKIIKEFKG